MKRYLPVLVSIFLLALSIQTYVSHRSEGGWRVTAALIGLVVFGIMTLVGLYTLNKKTN
ncbi:MAG: hypothetical protein IPQ08_09200 [Chitinophagaceae bacterium]|nr:hypothetical protein [Chitinophagaceae bacterium]